LNGVSVLAANTKSLWFFIKITGGVRTMRTDLRFELNPRPGRQATGATQRGRQSGSA